MSSTRAAEVITQAVSAALSRRDPWPARRASGCTPRAETSPVAPPAARTSTVTLITGDVVTVTLAAVTWNASGGSIGPYRYFVLYNDSHASDALLAFWDAGESKTLASGQQERFVLQSGGLTIRGL